MSEVYLELFRVLQVIINVKEIDHLQLFTSIVQNGRSKLFKVTRKGER